MSASTQFTASTVLRHFIAIFFIGVVFAIPSILLFAEDSHENETVEGHATVHLIFVFPYENPPPALQAPETMLSGMLTSSQSIRPISIAIDGEFVGHALVAGFMEVKPYYVLPHGKHTFEFQCEGFKASKTELTVIGTGSKQYLIVKLERSETASPARGKAEPAEAKEDPSKKK